MGTKVQMEEEPMKTHSPTDNLETDLALEFLRVVEDAAIASAKTMGTGRPQARRSGCHRIHAQRHGLGADGRNHRHRRRRTR